MKNKVKLREVLQQLVDPSYSVEDITGLTHNAKDLLVELPVDELNSLVYWDGLPEPSLGEANEYPETSKIWWVDKDGTVLEPHVFEVYLEIDRIDPFNPGSDFKPHVATTIKGIKWFSGEKPLIKELERWGNPESVKTGKVYWHKGRQQYLLVPGNPSKAEVAGGLAQKDQYGDDLPEDKAKEKSYLEFISVEELKAMAREMRAKDWYVDNVYGKRVYREEYDASLNNRQKEKAMTNRRRKNSSVRRRQRRSGFRRRKQALGFEPDSEVYEFIQQQIELGYDAEEIIEDVYQLLDKEPSNELLIYIDNEIEQYEKNREWEEAHSIRRLKGSWQKDPRVVQLIERGTELGHEVGTIVKAVVAYLGDTTIHYNKNENDAIWDVVRKHVEAFDAEREAYARRIARKRHQASCCGRNLRLRRRTSKKWETLPEGWDKESLESYWNSMGGSVSSCIKELKNDSSISDPGAFCASLKSRVEGSEAWRHRPRKRRRK